MISIIVPVYNGEKYIMNCADALINQTCADIEIIFVDDGSKDNTPALLKEISQKDNRVKVFTKSNGGVSSARNKGLAEATGKYIMFCDADDLPHNEWCKELFDCAEKFPDILPMCGALRKDLVGNSADFLFTIPKEKLSGEYTELSKIDLTMIDAAGMLYSLWNKIFSAEIIKNNDIRFDESISNGEDALFVFEYLSHIDGNMVFIDKTLYTYLYQNTESLSSQNSYNEFFTAEKVFNAAEKLFIKIGFPGADFEREFYNFYLDRFIEILSKIISNKKDARMERLKKSNSTLNSASFRKCLSNVDPKQSCNGKLIKIYRSKLMGKIYNFKLVYL